MNESRPCVLLLTFARRGEEEAIREGMAAVREDLPGAEFVALGTAVSAPVMRGLGLEDIILVGEGRGTQAVMREVRARAPRGTLVVYSGPGLAGHWKLELLALASGARRAYRWVPGGPMVVCGRLALAGSVVWKAGLAAVCLAVGGLVCGAAWLRLRGGRSGSGG